MSAETTIVLRADPSDAEDFDASVAGLERAQMGWRVRMLRHRLGLSQPEFAERYGISVANPAV